MQGDALPQFDGCQVVARLRTGAVTDEYHAIQQPLGREVLIKALSSSILPTSPFAATLEREARVLAALHHGSILQLYGYERRDDRMWLVLEWFDGQALDELLARGVRVSPAAAVGVALGVARALAHAHERGFVHRDVQPRNVMVGQAGGVKLVNFAVAVDEHLPSMPELLDASGKLGSPAYLSPEQILGEVPDPRSDLFSLGVVLYELLAGQRPFDGPDDRAITQRIRHDAPVPLAKLTTGVSGALERLVTRALQKLPADRFGSAVELVRALEAVQTEYGEGTAAESVAGWLRALGWATQAPTSSRELSARPRAEPAHGPRRALWGLGVASLAIVGGSILFHAGSSRSAPRPSRALAPSPSAATAFGALRVVAEPWAHVIVDGRHQETTPFARPIALTPGTHYLRFEHPQAPPERRTLQIAAGENVLLSIKMQVQSPDGGAPQPVVQPLADAAPPSP